MPSDEPRRSPWGAKDSSRRAQVTPPADTPPPPSPGQSAPPAHQLPGEFVGPRGSLFMLALKTGFFTVLTLGIYRFWMKTRLRRWYWSAIRIGGLPLEYVGDPIEKLLGFLIAVVILAFYVGVVNLLLMFASFSLFQDNYAAYLLSFVGVIPIWFYAQYRARRYVLARTRWRGLRFGLEPGAWGYAFRALVYWLLTLISAGLLWPLMTFRLEQYKTDRTSWGTARLVQGGRWTMLYGSAKWLFVGLVLGAVATGLVYSGSPEKAGIPGVLAAILGVYGLLFYRVDSLRRLTEAKRMADVHLSFAPSTLRVLGIHVGGYLVAALAIGLVIMVIGAIGVGTFLGSISALDDTELMTLLRQNQTLALALSASVYFTVFLLWSALTQALITLPVLRHYSTVLVLHGVEGLGDIRQRPRDEHLEAEGFAEALDVGASI